MRVLKADKMNQRELAEALRKGSGEETLIAKCCGQRYIGCGMKNPYIVIDGTPGNALGAFLDGGTIIVNGNGQDAVGDTMNAGRIIIDGSVGDAAGYAMRGGLLLVRNDAGYRAGVNMKAYGSDSPAIVIGGVAGSFLGEYQAGGTIVVLGLRKPKGTPLTGYFCGKGMYSGRIYLRTTELPIGMTRHLMKRTVSQEEKDSVLRPLIEEFAKCFKENAEEILSADFTAIEADPEHRYNELYAAM